MRYYVIVEAATVSNLRGVMKLHIRHRWHQPSPSLCALIRAQLETFGPRLRIEEARVLVERRDDASPAFRIAAHLVTPGPDVTAEGIDHTLRAALNKTAAEIEAKLDQRDLLRARRKQTSARCASRGRPVPFGSHA